MPYGFNAFVTHTFCDRSGVSFGFAEKMIHKYVNELANTVVKSSTFKALTVIEQSYRQKKEWGLNTLAKGRQQMHFHCLFKLERSPMGYKELFRSCWESLDWKCGRTMKQDESDELWFQEVHGPVEQGAVIDYVCKDLKKDTLGLNLHNV